MFKQLLLGGLIGSLPLAFVIGGLPAWSQTQQSGLEIASEPMTSGYLLTQAEADNISQDELQKFAEAVKKQRDLALETERKMIEVVENEGLTGQRFQEIAKQQQTNPDTPSQSISAEEMEKFNKAFPQVKELAQEDRKKQREMVQSQGFTIQRFNEIAKTVEDDRSLQQEVLKLMGN